MIAFDLFCLMRIAKIKCTFKLIRDPEFTERFGWQPTICGPLHSTYSISPSLNLNLNKHTLQHVCYECAFPVSQKCATTVAYLGFCFFLEKLDGSYT